MSRTKRCIYCWKWKPLDQFSEEHIIPRFMGGASNCPGCVTNDVCKSCNSLFGRFVDSTVARGFFQNSIEHGAWEACFDFNENSGNAYELTYFGKSRELDFGGDTDVEVWLCPDGGSAWHIHERQPEDFDSLAGGDPA
jgi:HNH endonuclease